ncbi:MAG: NAD(P)H-binding protein [Proteobacteria bacterium]|nr:NAD(P)H-binding protein [Pseudomonadota bacterium]
MKKQELHAVTGAYGFTGKYIAEILLKKKHSVITLTNSVSRQNHFGDRIKAYQYNFDQPEKLVESLQGIEVLYNTYWVRFNHKLFTHQNAVKNTLTLFEAARQAGVKKIVHVSITNPSLDSELEYFQGKAVLEEELKKSGVAYSILRPAVLFGREDILINNIAWLLRKLPVFPVFGYGSYRVQPIYVRDFAELAVLEGQRKENATINAIGPETYTYKGLIEKIGDIIGTSKPIVSVSPLLGYVAGYCISKFVKDVVVTKEEIKGLMSDLLAVDTQPTGKTKLSQWVQINSDIVGMKYASELSRRVNRESAYAV